MTASELALRATIWLPLCCIFGLLAVVSLRDVALRLLPNSMALALVSIGCFLRWQDGTLLVGLAASTSVFALCFFCWRRGWVGGGDVKLMAACAMLVAPHNVVDFIVLTTLTGGLLGLLYIGAGWVLRRAPSVPDRTHRRSLVQRLWRVERQRILRRAPLPYGVAISISALILLAGAPGPLGH